MPVAHLAFERKSAPEVLVQEQRGLDAVMIFPQTLRCHGGEFEPRHYVAQPSLIREARKGRYGLKALRLEPAYRHFHKRREAAERRVFHIRVQLLEVYGFRHAGARSRGIGIKRWWNCSL